jgi:hypothetical protein
MKSQSVDLLDTYKNGYENGVNDVIRGTNSYYLRLRFYYLRLRHLISKSEYTRGYINGYTQAKQFFGGAKKEEYQLPRNLIEYLIMRIKRKQIWYFLRESR